jgi:hypothetical protein
MSLFTTLKAFVSKLSLGWLIGFSLLALVTIAGIAYGIYYGVWKYLHSIVGQRTIIPPWTDRVKALAICSLVNSADNVNITFSVNPEIAPACLNNPVSNIQFINYEIPTDKSQINKTWKYNYRYVVRLHPTGSTCKSSENYYLTYDATNLNGNYLGATTEVEYCAQCNLYTYSNGQYTQGTGIFYDTQYQPVCLVVENYGANYVLTQAGFVPQTGAENVLLFYFQRA